MLSQEPAGRASAHRLPVARELGAPLADGLAGIEAQKGQGSRLWGCPPQPPPRRELEAGGESGEMSLDRQRASVRSLVTAYETRWEPPGCGCCLLPARGASSRPRQRGCCSPPAPSRDASPARERKPKESPPAPRKLNSCRQESADQRLVSLLLVLHSGTNSSMIAIDNKIEQAMDLVKSHLMFAVREEVEVLREQIKELSERNAALEQENNLLRSLANTEQTGHFQAQLHENKPHGGSA